MLPKRPAAAEFAFVLVRLRADVPTGARTQSVANRRSRSAAVTRGIRKSAVCIAECGRLRGFLAARPTCQFADRRGRPGRADVLVRLLLCVGLAAGNVAAAGSSATAGRAAGATERTILGRLDGRLADAAR
jgi:hypothetical protein